MEEKQGKGSSALLWVLLLIAFVVLWWYLQPGEEARRASIDPGATPAELAADEAAGLDADADDILIDLKDDASAATIAAIERDLGIDLVLVSDQSFDERFYRAHVDAAQRDALLAALSARPEVEIAEPDALAYLPSADLEMAADWAPPSATWEGYPNDPKYKHQWHLRQINMPEAWKLENGKGVIVAVLDTGVAFENHGKFHLVPDLAGVTFVKPWDFVGNTAHAGDDHGHGTHVTGTIAQATNNGIGVAGVAPGVSIMPLKVLSASGSGSVAGIADAIRYAADNGAQVINMSLGGRFPSRVLKKAVEYAHGKGVTVVCAAGNESRGKVGYPAAYPGAVAVAATQFDETTTFYSNYGKDIDIAAPGGNVRVDQDGDGMPDGVLQNTIVIGDPTRDDYFGYMGTSMASPHAAGVAALVVAAGVTKPDQVEAILKESARKPTNQKYDVQRYGAGIIDAAAAITKARGAVAVATTGGTTDETRSLAADIVLGLLLAGAVAAAARRSGLGVVLGPTYLVGAVVGATGLAIVTMAVPCLAACGAVQLLTLSAVIPVGLMALGYGMPRLRGPLAGVVVGAAAHLLVHVLRGTDLAWVPSLFVVDQVWLAANALVCVAVARAALRR